MFHNKLQNKFYRTSNFYISAFLCAKGVDLVSIDKVSDPKRASFIFLDSPNLGFLIHCFSFCKENDSEVMVDARKFVTVVKQLKEKLYQEENNND